MGKMSKTKGSRYELRMSKVLSEWWGAEFHRTPNSGAWSSTHASDMQAGDIITPISAGFPFVVECKHHEGWTLENVIMNTGSHRDWWMQTVGDCIRVGKIPFLLFHRNLSRNFITIPFSAVVEKRLSDSKKEYAKHHIHIEDKMLETTTTYTVITTTLESFSEVYKPDELRKYHKTIFKDWYKILKEITPPKEDE